jgi:hypothetical protein
VASLEIILDWYGGLPKGAREKLSLANLHDLSKLLEATPAEIETTPAPRFAARAPTGKCDCGRMGQYANCACGLR